MSRAEEAARRVELAAGQERAESVKAQQLIEQFLADAQAAGIAPEPLKATLYTGQSVKTDKRGWYLRKNQSVAIGDDGAYYILTVPGGWTERLRGVKLTPTPPPLIVGKGGRDGETGDIAEFLRARLSDG
ncbi:MAG TPA: hypothetical protein VEQ66_02345 [Propionibacteriaceae bacterium]|nr:hypothetical protein [Propionibacteriaceae bacterium]